ncbi:MAG TPA: DUF72 domain-containing protein [Balneolaceae bacterium]|nr:DUF72 domain-containing protein [Balneolaceae bacterium]
MKFGRVEKPDTVNFSLPDDHPETKKVLSNFGASGKPQIYVGCAKWNRQELKGFYPRGTKDELEYYASQFNAVELNATFYRNFPADQISSWCEKVPDEFRFFPKVNQQVSHRKWLSDIKEATEDFLNSISHFQDKLGTSFLQLRDKFAPKYFDRVSDFVEFWPQGFPLAVEFRHPDWFNDESVAKDLHALLEENNVANIIVDTAGKRDLMHMRLTNNEAFIRYVGANHPTDYARLDDWTLRLKKWLGEGLQNIHFFVHQNEERESPKLAAHFIEKLNEEIGTNLKIPKSSGDDSQGDMF